MDTLGKRLTETLNKLGGQEKHLEAVKAIYANPKLDSKAKVKAIAKLEEK